MNSFFGLSRVSKSPWQLTCTHTSLYTFSPKSDQHQFSPKDVNTKSREKAMRIYFICNGFYQILSTNSVTILYIGSVSKICLWILGLRS